MEQLDIADDDSLLTCNDIQYGTFEALIVFPSEARTAQSKYERGLGLPIRPGPIILSCDPDVVHGLQPKDILEPSGSVHQHCMISTARTVQ